MVLASGAGSFISDAIGNTINDFVDWAMVVVIIMLIWYVIKFFLVSPPSETDRASRKDRKASEAEEAKRKRDELGAERTRRREAAELTENQKRRDRLMRLPLSNLVHAMNDCSDIVRSLTSGRNATQRVSATGNATRSLNSCHSRLRKAAKAARGALHSESDRTLHESLNNIYHFIGAAEHSIASVNIPAHADPNWVNLANHSITEINNIRAGLDSIRQAIDQYVDAGTKATISGIAASGSPPRTPPSPSPGAPTPTPSGYP